MSNRISELFIWMAAVYGRTWTSQYAGETAKVAAAAWSEGLSELSDGHVEAGRHAVLKRGGDWPPSLPEFRRLCLGLGEAGAAIEAAMRGDRTHPIARHLIAGVISFDRDRLSAKDLEKRYRAGLADARQAAERDAITRPALEAL